LRLFLDFLQGPARQGDELLILGDLFEVWIGDDGNDAVSAKVVESLREVAQSGTKCAVLVGNRDFLLGERFCARAGVELLAEPVQRSFDSLATVLLHGDILCTDDVPYQRLRRKVRDPAWQARFRSRPRWWRGTLAGLARTLSRLGKKARQASILDVNEQAVEDCFRRHGVVRLIHGHTHRPGIHRYRVDGRDCQRIVLGDWHPQAACIARLRGGRAELLELGYDASGALRMTPRSTADPPVLGP